jgi:hypothetical protein
LCHKALSEWHLGEIVCCKAKLDEAISLPKKLNDTNALALALGWAAGLTANISAIYRGWAHSVSGNTVEGIPWIEQE